MPKMKTRRAAAKRFKKTGTGEFKRAKAFKSHILEHKSPSRKRNLRTAAFLLRVHDQFCEQVQPYASFSCGKEIYVQEYGF